jgi:hypothetical protein
MMIVKGLAEGKISGNHIPEPIEKTLISGQSAGQQVEALFSSLEEKRTSNHRRTPTTADTSFVIQSSAITQDAGFVFQNPKRIVTLPLTTMSTKDLELHGNGDAYAKELPARYMLPYNWSIDVLFVSGVSWAQYGKKGIQNMAFYRGRDSATVSYSFYDAGFRLQRTNLNGSFFSAGFCFGQRRDQFGFLYSFDTPQTVIDSSKYITIIDPVLPPQTIRTYDTTLVFLRQSRKLAHEVSIQYYRIPLRTGYRFVQERMSFFVSCGVDLGWIRASGKVIHPGTMESLDLAQSKIYRSGVLSDVVFSIGWEWRLATKVSIVAEPFLTKAITNLYQQSEYGTSRPFQAAVLTGIRLKP